MFKYLLFFLIAFASVAKAITFEGKDVDSLHKPIEGQFIVRFKPNFKNSPFLKALQLLRSLGDDSPSAFDLGNLLHVYSNSIIGFAVRGLNDAHVEQLGLDSDVLSIEQVRSWSLCLYFVLRDSSSSRTI